MSRSPNGTSQADVPKASRSEQKREAFLRLAERRTNTVLEKVRILGNLANHYAYEWTEDDVRLIFNAIDEEVRLTRARFLQTQRKGREFKIRRGLS